MILTFSGRPRRLQARQLEGGLVRFAAAGGEEDVVQVAGRQFRQPPGKADRRLIAEADVVVGEGQRPDLLCRRLSQLASTVADIDVPQAGHAVKIAPAIDVPEHGAPAPGQDHRLLLVDIQLLGMDLVGPIQGAQFARPLGNGPGALIRLGHRMAPSRLWRFATTMVGHRLA
jgi:hypothetical protein